MKHFLASTLCVAICGCASVDIARENSRLLHHLKQSTHIAIDDWRRPGGDSRSLVGRDREEFVSMIKLQDQETTAETYCQCIGDFRVTLDYPKDNPIRFFICHWKHLSIGEELNVERQVFLTSESAERLKAFLFFRIFLRPAEAGEANKAPEPTPVSVTPRAGARVAPAPVVAHL